MANTTAASLKYTLHQYDTHNYLQRLGVWEFDPVHKGKYWIVYIHGGAWRDPRVDHTAFTSSIDHILNTSPPSPDNNSLLAGFASLDYRLSPHPLFPPPSPSNKYQQRIAQHPDHLNDIQSALAFLQRTYTNFHNNYILVGHSAGAALACQFLASPSSKPPAAVIGFGGLYDFSGIDARNNGAYAVFFNGAFGDDRRAWDSAAPIGFPAGTYGDASTGLILIGSSPGDTLVDEVEAENMARRLVELDGFVEEDEGKGKGRLIRMTDLQGDHDEVWREGVHVARMVWRVLGALEG